VTLSLLFGGVLSQPDSTGVALGKVSKVTSGMPRKIFSYQPHAGSGVGRKYDLKKENIFEYN